MTKKVKKLNFNESKFYKMFFTVEELNGQYSGFIQIGGFDTEEEARLYLAKYAKDDSNIEILTEIPTIH